ncbi:MAG: hypothetical protein HC819_04105 [Cyclobacteriaceae bacterium]|nr:hypothetical protein [Cyclobacteriaceae bacterium]
MIDPRILKIIVMTTFFIVMFFIQGCEPKLVSEESLQEYVRETSNGLSQTVKREGIEVSAFYRPTDLIVAQDLRQKDRNAVAVRQLREKYGSYAYFVLSMSYDGKDALYATAGSYQEFSDNLQKLSFRMPEYLYMTTSEKDTVELRDFHFSRMHGMSGSTQVLLAFEKDKIEYKEWIQLNLKEMGFGTGRVNLRFRMKDILDTPEIDFFNKGNYL